MTNLAAITPASPPLIARLARQAMIDEVCLTPKPGLVDRDNNGAHRDMDLALFMRSIAAIAPWFSQFYQLGFDHARRPASEMLAVIRPAGIACEQAMFSATAGVNTHKGGIFSLGLLCVAAGRLSATDSELTQRSLCRQVSEITHGLVARELVNRQRGSTAGERLYQRWQLTGARGEVESGFATVRQSVLPFWQAQQPGERRLHHALLRLMAVNPDTNLAARGGLHGMQFVQRYAQKLLQNGWDSAALEQMDRALIARNLSPGGSADLLAVAQVLAAFAP
ncbi:triphosphoribosyl-dephospho-CoA synthase CitG [Izhakiella australiensis]|uniref:Probable 2-(5''-triphosphoribosyl)-3'-dephosphocoenzyme-A synthase n=1 Tax=Izhakiella australiensis TaxID=1926881 RepID=A0A1S8YPW9_9GAMM|nr:triphosphoribosyl-dephospho-CoA synthase CitG [Izhakiella australiensis]OON41114.1 triphosphoribosyl-dephospho-CoA synthase CitG [Izhakiella australiensis]